MKTIMYLSIRLEVYHPKSMNMNQEEMKDFVASECDYSVSMPDDEVVQIKETEIAGILDDDFSLSL